MRHLSLLVACLATVAVPVLGAQDVARSAGPDDGYREELMRWPAEGRAVALSVSLRAPGSAVAFATGTTEQGVGRPVERTDLFEIGSITKGFTGILLADMVLRGEVALDDPVARYLPTDWNIPTEGEAPITLLDLATHTSGLPRLPSGFAPADPERPYAGSDLTTLRDALRTTGLARPVTAGYAYSNLGMAVLGQALAQRAGMPYDALLRERVLAPLGMTDSHVGVAAAPAARLVAGHQTQFIPVAHWDLGSYAPAGGLISSAAELTTLMAAMLHPDDSPVGRAIALATTPVRALGAGADSIGLAWHLAHRNGHRVIWHNGGTGGFRSWLGVDRTGERGAVLLNSASFAWTDPVGLAMTVGDSLPTIPAARAVTPLDLPVSDRHEYLGRYVLTPEVTITVAEVAGHLTAQLTGQGALRLVGDDRDHFVMVLVPAALRFERDADGAVTAVVLVQGGREQRAPRDE